METMTYKESETIQYFNIGKTLFFMSEKVNFPLGYLVTSFRKREIDLQPAISHIVERMYRLEEKLPNKSDSYVDLVYKAKESVYFNRYDSERELGTVIHEPMEKGMSVTLSQAWDIVMNGHGHSATTGKHLKVITCTEKRRKVFKALIDLLNEVA